jgi:hypothetical protein
MRLNFTAHSGQHQIVHLHAGDEIAFVTQARRLQVFRDQGAFDRRALVVAGLHVGALAALLFWLGRVEIRCFVPCPEPREGLRQAQAPNQR